MDRGRIIDPGAPGRLSIERPLLRPAWGLVRASHFQPTLAVTALTTALAVLAGRGPKGAILVALAVLAGQCSVGWSNDWLDASRDRLNDRTDKPIVAQLVTMRTVRTAAITALVIAVPLSFLSGWRAGSVHLIALGSAWAYNAGLKATLISPLPYALSFALLPAFVTLGLPAHPWPRPAVMVVTGLFGVGAHFINTLPDRDADKASGINGLPQRVSASVTLCLGVAFLGTAAVLTWTLHERTSVVPSVLLAASLGCDVMVVATTARGHARSAWTWSLCAAVSALILFAVTRPTLIA